MLAWSEKFATHVESIDKQHKKLFELLNQLAICLGRGDPQDAVVLHVVGELLDYASQHFMDEEVYMVQKKIDPRHVALQRMEHKSFIFDVERMREGLLGEEGLREQSGKLLRFVTMWLTYHILGTDIDLVAQVKSIDGGASPAEAYELEMAKKRDNTTTRLMLDALLGLWREASEKNQKLEEEQDILRRSKE